MAALHAEGRGRNAIAAELGLGNSTVARITKALVLDFSRAQDAVAVHARLTRLAEMHTRLAEKIAAIAGGQLDRARKPNLVYSFGGEENTFNEETLDQLAA
ncbi:hypothetical protein [Curtobacterium sp. HSID17257]|uniref:hypothetical protein n=1 Tax=Curtobacterium sp. HSID17257 TaxID=2419510 RepID=UPI000F89439B|nr:hypothetical protein [Curtobacterium sp. HSID17257]